MGRCGKRRGFSRRAGLEFSGTTATARVFGTEAAAPRRGLCPSVPRLSVPHRTNRVAPCGAAIAVDGQKTPPHPAFSHPLPRGARELETRSFSRGKVKVPGHSKVFPIGMCYIWEVEGDDNFEVFKEVPIFKTAPRGRRVQSRVAVGLFCCGSRDRDTPTERPFLSHFPVRFGEKRSICRAPRGCDRNRPGRSLPVGKIRTPAPWRDRPPFQIRPLGGPHNVVNADALFGIVNPSDSSPHGKNFFNPNPARATPRWFPSPFPSPRRGKGITKQRNDLP